MEALLAMIRDSVKGLPTYYLNASATNSSGSKPHVHNFEEYRCRYKRTGPVCSLREETLTADDNSYW
eukprot:8449997-Pyramimonas_sp.AAC.2